MAAGSDRILLEALKLGAMALLGGGTGGVAGNILGRVAMGATGSGLGGTGMAGLSPLARRFTANDYPTSFAPGRWHEYKVVNIPGDPNYNQHGKADAATIDEAGEMQDLQEHNRAITQYLRPGMTPQEQRLALDLGMKAEKMLPKFWNESNDRRPFAVSSSAVTGIRLTPDARIEVQWRGSPTWYTFKEYPDTHSASLAAKELLKADSIGRAVMPWQRNGKPLKFKKPGDIAWWNMKNYDAGYAS